MGGSGRAGRAMPTLATMKPLRRWGTRLVAASTLPRAPARTPSPLPHRSSRTPPATPRSFPPSPGTLSRQLRPRCAMDRSVHASAAKQGTVGSIDDSVHIQLRNIASHYFEFGHGLPPIVCRMRSGRTLSAQRAAEMVPNHPKKRRQRLKPQGKCSNLSGHQPSGSLVHRMFTDCSSSPNRARSRLAASKTI